MFYKVQEGKMLQKCWHYLLQVYKCPSLSFLVDTLDCKHEIYSQNVERSTDKGTAINLTQELWLTQSVTRKHATFDLLIWNKSKGGASVINVIAPDATARLVGGGQRKRAKNRPRTGHNRAGLLPNCRMLRAPFTPLFEVRSFMTQNQSKT